MNSNMNNYQIPENYLNMKLIIPKLMKNVDIDICFNHDSGVVFVHHGLCK